MSIYTKFFLILIQAISLLLITLNYLNIINNNYIPIVGYSIIFISLVYVVVFYKRDSEGYN